MEYPKKYPDGFLMATYETKDRKILVEGLNFYQKKIDSALNPMRAGDIPLAVFALNAAKESLLQFEPDARKVVDVLAEFIGPGSVIIQVKAE